MLAELQRWLHWRIRKPAEIGSASPTDRERRLEVYSSAYLTRHVEALAKDFKAVQRVLGEEPFSRLVSRYLEACPSQSPNIAGLGRAFPGFISSSELVSLFPFLPDLAELEWRLIELFHAPDSRLSVRLLQADWPVDEIWNASGDAEPLPDIKAAPTLLLLIRHGFERRVKRLAWNWHRLRRS